MKNGKCPKCGSNEVYAATDLLLWDGESTRKISDQLGHARVSMTQDRYLGRKLTGNVTAELGGDFSTKKPLAIRR